MLHVRSHSRRWEHKRDQVSALEREDTQYRNKHTFRER